MPRKSVYARASGEINLWLFARTFIARVFILRPRAATAAVHEYGGAIEASPMRYCCYLLLLLLFCNCLASGDRVAQLKRVCVKMLWIGDKFNLRVAWL